MLFACVKFFRKKKKKKKFEITPDNLIHYNTKVPIILINGFKISLSIRKQQNGRTLESSLAFLVSVVHVVAVSSCIFLEAFNFLANADSALWFSCPLVLVESCIKVSDALGTDVF